MNRIAAWKLSPRYSTQADHPRAFQDLKLCPNSQRLVRNLGFVDEPHCGVCAAAWRDWFVWTVNELHAQHFAITSPHSQVRAVVSEGIGGEANGRSSPSFRCGQEFDPNFCKSGHAFAPGSGDKGVRIMN
jgi:hypothetical protein